MRLDGAACGRGRAKGSLHAPFFMPAGWAASRRATAFLRADPISAPPCGLSRPGRPGGRGCRARLARRALAGGIRRRTPAWLGQICTARPRQLISKTNCPPTENGACGWQVTGWHRQRFSRTARESSVKLPALGLVCPFHLVEAKEAMEKLNKGDCLELSLIVLKLQKLSLHGLPRKAMK